MPSELEDAHAVRRLKHAYCFAIDGGRYEEWVSLFTEDGTFVRDDGTAYEGREALLGFATKEFDPRSPTRPTSSPTRSSTSTATRRPGSGISSCSTGVARGTSA
jgi:hypothetical protein